MTFVYNQTISPSYRILTLSNQRGFMKLTIQNLGKEYKRGFWGLKDFSLEIKPGILGLLGPNGAGKSTFMRMLATITKPTDGKILWNDIDVAKNPDALRDVLGYLPQDFGVYPNLNGIEFLEYMAAIKGLDASIITVIAFNAGPQIGEYHFEIADIRLLKE